MKEQFVDADPGMGAPGESKELPNNGHKDMVRVSDLSEYDFIAQTFHSDGNYRTGTLVRAHEREDDESYRGRREMAFLKNFLRPVVNSRVDPIQADQIIRNTKGIDGGEAVAPYWEAFQKDADGSGQTIGKFMDALGREGNLHSLVLLVMDNHKQEERSQDVGTNVEKRLYPYVYFQTRDTVQGYSCTSSGALQWIRFYDHSEKDPKDNKVTHFFRYWDAKESRLEIPEKYGANPADYKQIEKWTTVETSPHSLGVIPVYPMAFVERRKRSDGLSIDHEFYELARCNWTIFNLDSATMEAIFQQCFSLLCIQGPKTDNVSVGTRSILWVAETVPNMPGYIAPDPNVAKIAADYSGAIKMDIFEIAEQNGVTAKKTAGANEQSGKAKEWDFQAHGFILVKITGYYRSAEAWISDMFQRYTGEKFVYVPYYRESYAVTDSISKIEVQEKVLESVTSPKAKALAEKNIARIAFAGNSKDEVEPVMLEMDEMAKDAEEAEDTPDPDAEPDPNADDNADAGVGDTKNVK